MTNFRILLAAGVALLGVAGPALAGDGPRLVGGGENAQVVYDDTDRGNVAGGGRMIVENDVERGFKVTYLDRVPATGVGVARLIGGGENTVVAYGPPSPSAASGALAQRR